MLRRATLLGALFAVAAMASPARGPGPSVRLAASAMAWTPVGPMGASHLEHVAVLLNDGRVLVAGGPTTQAELYDPATQTFSPAGSTGAVRWELTGTLLPSGKVLIAGGSDPNGGTVEASTEIFDPGSNTFSPGAPMNFARAGHTATLLADGRVLVVGGNNLSGSSLQTAETWDGTAWTMVGNPTAQRTRHVAILLPDGRVLVAGGIPSPATSELFDPASGTFTAGPAMVSNHDGGMVALGTYVIGPYAATERYDPQSGAWSAAASMTMARTFAAGAPIAGGLLVAAGSTQYAPQASQSAEVFYGTSWAATAPMAFAHGTSPAAAALLDGDVLVTGGVGAMTSAELFHPRGLATPCSSPSDCETGFCVEGVCCSSACPAPCGACTVANGAQQDGVCFGLTGPACDDGDPCTSSDTCQAGACAGSPVVCASDPCATRTCNGTAACTVTPASDGTPCSDGRSCTVGDQCAQGVCVPGASTCACSKDADCPAADGCHPGACDVPSGTCGTAVAADGTACDDGRSCTWGDRCVAGQCLPTNNSCACSSDADCPSLGQCSAPGTCDLATGACTNPPSPDGTACDDGNPCTSRDVCRSGTCGGTPHACTATECQASSRCDGRGGCTVTNKPDGTGCSSGACSGGTCKTPPPAGGGSGGGCGGCGCAAGCAHRGSMRSCQGDALSGACQCNGGPLDTCVDAACLPAGTHPCMDASGNLLPCCPGLVCALGTQCGASPTAGLGQCVKAP